MITTATSTVLSQTDILTSENVKREFCRGTEWMDECRSLGTVCVYAFVLCLHSFDV